jgi:hypothetical protein
MLKIKDKNKTSKPEPILTDLVWKILVVLYGKKLNNNNIDKGHSIKIRFGLNVV